MCTHNALPPCAPRQGAHVLKHTRMPTLVHACTHVHTHTGPRSITCRQRRLCPPGVKLPSNRRKAAQSLSCETPLRENAKEKL